MHKVDFVVISVSVVCTICNMAMWNDAPRMVELLANCSVVRILVVHPGFRHLLYSCSAGFAPLRVYLVLMLVVYYYFSLAAFHLFRRFELTHNFDTLGDSMLTLHQVFVGNPRHAIYAIWNLTDGSLGEGWNGMMYDIHALNLNPATYFFFILFYLAMAILFTQLLAGVFLACVPVTTQVSRAHRYRYQPLPAVGGDF